MRAAGVALLVASALAAPAQAAQVMVVGRSGTLVAPKTASVKAATVKVEGRRCRVAGRTPLAALARTRVRLTLRDYGACGSRAADSGALYVQAVAGQRERGAAGWVYKVDDRTPSLGAGDPSARFRDRSRVLWFWCRDASGCQRTLSARADRTEAAPGETVRVTVRAHDDQGAAIPAAGATVTLGSERATAGADGVAELTVPAGATGTLRAVATRRGLVRSFPVVVRVR